MKTHKVLFTLSLLFALATLIITALFFWSFVLGGCYPSYCAPGGPCTADCGGSPPAIIFIILGVLMVIDLMLWMLFGYLYRKKDTGAVYKNKK